MKINPVANNPLQSFIVELPGFFNQSFCNQIIEAANSSGLFEYEYAHIKRENYVAILAHGDVFVDERFNGDMLNEIKKKFYFAIKLYFDQIKKCFSPDDGPMSVSYELDIVIRKYGSGGRLRHHFDSTVITALVGLNDSYEGGELAFWGDELPRKLPARSIMLFPGNFMYSHNVAPVTSGERYVLVAQWLPPVAIYKRRRCDNGYYLNGYTRSGKEVIPSDNNPEQSVYLT